MDFRIKKYDEQSKELRSYGWQPDSTWGTHPLWLKQHGAYYWYHNDHLGTPQTLVDSAGTVVWAATYTAFGNATIQVDTIENPLRFPGQYFDAETGLHYNWNRYYDPEIGRYTQPDPIGFDGGDVNLYVYVGNNPISTIDPYGLWWLSDFLEGWLDNRARRAWGLPTNPVSDIAYDGAVTVVQTAAAGVEFVGAGVCDPFDAAMTIYHCGNGDCSTGAVVGAALPIVSGKFGEVVENVLKNASKWIPPQVKAFEKAGIQYTEHFATRISGRGARGITPQKALDAYNNGRLYYNPATKNYIRHNTRTGISVVVSQPSQGTAITVFEGNPSPDWIPIKWRNGNAN